ncbi:transcriptional regulator, TetR family [Cohaesibacter sp. ES.047]|uniref:transcriptional regulator BetI n=1 Tax=Cohaesibacter sp. ES.047 TaxID=1798205 RepID=UPI000BB6ABEC|nr:transcriptional regulator BetI [Cohaesibacter sp. ES.047]SNY91360.1 transcriptional regulator, TetR family [Cohaesibacter sp. ES.047]
MVRKSEQERREELIAATIREVAAVGSLNVTTSQIAKSAGVSAGLAFHYFKDKDSLFLAAMRDILTRYGSDVRAALGRSQGPQARLEAIVHSSFNNRNFTREAIASWLIFYTLALKSPVAQRLLYVYQRRLHSNLVFNLRGLIGGRSPDVARRVAGLIDGLYLRYALDETTNAGHEAADHVLRAIAAECTEVRENDEISIDEADPSPMDPFAKPQE